jgi:branched-chain amino acid transport system permease protein
VAAALGGRFMTIDIFLQILVGGVLLGGMYALVAFGLSLIYGVAQILNFAHGTLLAVGGVLAAAIFAGTQWNPLILIAILIPIFMVFGYFFYDRMLQPLRQRNEFEYMVGSVLVTVGTLLILTDVAVFFAGPSPKNIPVEFDIIEIGEVLITTNQLYILGGIIVLTGVLHVFIKRSWFGRAMRAVTQDHVGAAICGVRSRSIHAWTFAFGSAIVAIAAVLYTMLYPVDPYIGLSLTVKAFTIIILGGIGNLMGALFAGIFLGLAESLTSFFWATQWAPAISIIMLLVILVLFPQGLLTRRPS